MRASDFRWSSSGSLHLWLAEERTKVPMRVRLLHNLLRETPLKQKGSTKAAQSHWWTSLDSPFPLFLCPPKELSPAHPKHHISSLQRASASGYGDIWLCLSAICQYQGCRAAPVLTIICTQPISCIKWLRKIESKSHPSQASSSSKCTSSKVPVRIT